MAQNKHLHELLRENQEPFILNDYIADRRRHHPKTQIQLRKRRPVDDPSPSPFSFPHGICEAACFFTSRTSPDATKSPLFPRSPGKTPNPVFLHAPSRTAAVLLEAAVRIQRPKSRKAGFGLLIGSVLRKLTRRHRNKRRGADDGRVSVRDIIRWDSSGELGRSKVSEENAGAAVVTSVSDSISVGSLGFLASPEGDFCESPIRFTFYQSPSPDRRTPEMPSPPAPPPCRNEEKIKNREENGNHGGGAEVEDKEQCSPVSVLDPPFGDDNEDAIEDGFDVECSYTNVQRAKQQLLQKISRFEKLAELDPFELEKLMEEEEEEDGEDNESREAPDSGDLYCEFLGDRMLQRRWQTARDMKRLVSEMAREEEIGGDEEGVAKRVCRRLEAWGGVEGDTIDMMVEMDFRRGLDGWRSGGEREAGEVAVEIEGAILGFLVWELLEEVADAPLKGSRMF